MTGNKKLSDAILGLAIGDALGVPYEFYMRGAFKCWDMVGFGTHHQQLGTWSDDTSMTIATAKSIKGHNGTIDVDDMRQNFMEWFTEGKFTPGGRVFDIGCTTMNALASGEPGVDVRDNGNGSLMRILPLAFTDCSDDEIRAVSAITHGHFFSTEACVIYVHIARKLLEGEDIDAIIPTLVYEYPFNRLSMINTLSEDVISSSGYVVSTLEAALWAIVHRDKDERSFKQTVLDAVNLGYDTDTVAAVTGGLAGIIYGLDGEDDWLSKLKGKDIIMDCLW